MARDKGLCTCVGNFKIERVINFSEGQLDTNGLSIKHFKTKEGFPMQVRVGGGVLCVHVVVCVV